MVIILKTIIPVLEVEFPTMVIQDLCPHNSFFLELKRPNSATLNQSLRFFLVLSSQQEPSASHQIRDKPLGINFDSCAIQQVAAYICNQRSIAYIQTILCQIFSFADTES